MNKQAKASWEWSVNYQPWLRAAWHAMSSGSYRCYANPIGRWVWRKHSPEPTP